QDAGVAGHRLPGPLRDEVVPALDHLRGFAQQRGVAAALAAKEQHRAERQQAEEADDDERDEGDREDPGASLAHAGQAHRHQVDQLEDEQAGEQRRQEIELQREPEQERRDQPGGDDEPRRRLVAIVVHGTAAGRASCASLAARAASGKRTSNSLPLPTPSLLAAIVPPCSSTSLRASDRPMPCPPCACGLADSTCPNMSKIRSMCSSAMPMPVSLTLTTSAEPSADAVTAIVPPGGVYFAELISTFEKTCARRVRSPWSARVCAGRSTCSSCPADSISGCAISIA